MGSIWSDTTCLEPRPALSGDLEAEAVVIGGGMAGILTAYYLKERGIESVVLEAARIGSGQPQNTTAKVTAQHGLVYDKLLRTAGEEKARQYAAANQRAVEEYRRLVREKGIDCDWTDCPAYLYSAKAAEPMRMEAEAARRLGLSAAFTSETELPFQVKGAVRLDGQARFHPLHFLKAIAQDLTIYEKTRVETVEGGEVKTARGTVRAKHIVFACHFPFVNAPGYYFLRMHQERSYVLALEGAQRLSGMYLGTDADGLSFRRSGELLLLGGGNHRTGENTAGGKYELLRRSAQRFWPESRESAHWSAQDCMPLDGIPYIGRFSGSTPDWYVATGFGKWGMTSSMAAALRISELVTGGEAADSAVFSPKRFDLPASAKNLLEDGRQAVKGLARSLLTPPRAELEALAPGRGGVVEWDGEKAGVYRDETGELFVVSVRCPHLGCQLEWNPDEKTWDCPCHGSRFDYRGQLLDGPAQEHLPAHREAQVKGSSV